VVVGWGTGCKKVFFMVLEVRGVNFTPPPRYYIVEGFFII